MYIYHIFFIPSPVGRHRGCSHVLAIVNSAAVGPASTSIYAVGELPRVAAASVLCPKGEQWPGPPPPTPPLWETLQDQQVHINMETWAPDFIDASLHLFCHERETKHKICPRKVCPSLNSDAC